MLCRRYLLASVAVISVTRSLCAAAQDTHCTNQIGDVQVRGNLNITARCELVGTSVRGNVRIFAGGALIARDAEIRGNLDAERADFVNITDSEIEGNVDLRALVGDASAIGDTEIDGNATLSDNRSSLQVLNNDFGGNVKITGNGGGVQISGNYVDGNLECSGNSPAPIGVGNRVDRKSEGQCASLRPEPTPPAPAAPPSGGSPPGQTTPPAATPPIASGGGAIRDATPPTLTLRGDRSVTLTVGSPYTDAGATAMDSTDGDLTSRIVVANPVNTALIGTFTVTYSVSDQSGNAATPLTRTVTVQPLPAVGGGGAGAMNFGFVLLLSLLAIGRAVERHNRRAHRRA